MKLNQGRHKPFEFAAEDVISKLPDIVITNILDRLPLQDAVRTGVLSRNWRFKWTMLSQLVIDEGFFAYLSKTQGNYNHVRIISRILLHLRGFITTFVLAIYSCLLDAEDINHWILFLSRKGIKDLTLNNYDNTPFKLPTHLFSCLELKHLKLRNCCFDPPLGFYGFPNLLSLELWGVQVGSNDLGEFFTRCRLLESLKLYELFSTREAKVVEIPRLENLKILWCDLEPMITNSSTIIFELLGSFPKLQELDLDFFECELTEGDVKKRFPTSLPSLKALKLSNIHVDSDTELSCAFELVKSSPNLASLEIITTKDWNNDSARVFCSFEEAYNTMGRLQLRNVVFTACCDASEKDISMIKYLLACSPFLKKFVIHFDELIELDEKLIFATKVVKLQRAYPAVDIDLDIDLH